MSIDALIKITMEVEEATRRLWGRWWFSQPRTPAEKERDLQSIPGYAPRGAGQGKLPKPTIGSRGDDE